MNEYWLYFLFSLTNIPLYWIILQLIRDRQVLQDEMFLLCDQLMQERTERRYSDMEEGNSDETSSDKDNMEVEESTELDDDKIAKRRNIEEKHEKSD